MLLELRLLPYVCLYYVHDLQGGDLSEKWRPLAPGVAPEKVEHEDGADPRPAETRNSGSSTPELDRILSVSQMDIQASRAQGSFGWVTGTGS